MAALSSVAEVWEYSVVWDENVTNVTSCRLLPEMAGRVLSKHVLWHGSRATEVVCEHHRTRGPINSWVVHAPSGENVHRSVDSRPDFPMAPVASSALEDANDDEEDEQAFF